MSEKLKKQAEAIGHESMLDTNTAKRVGEVLTNIVDETDEVSQISYNSIKNSNEFLNEYLDEINGGNILEGSIAQKLKTTLKNKNAIKQMIQDKGVDMSDNPLLSQYAERISSIQSNKIWSPNPTWWDIRAIIQDSDNQEYPYKTILLLLASDISTTFTGGAAYKTSDGKYYTNENVTHTWNPTMDKECLDKEVIVYKTRWVIIYHSSPTIEMNYIPWNCLYFIMDGILPTVARLGNADFNVTTSMLNSFDMINDANFTNITDFSSMFGGCSFLKTIPQIDTSNGVNFEGMFALCLVLTTIPQINTSKGINFTATFAYCISLTSIPPLNTSKGTDFGVMFEACFSIISIPPLDTSNGTDFQMMFSSCHKLTSVPYMNTSNGTYFKSMFENCASLKYIGGLDVSKSISRADSPLYLAFQNCYLLESIKISNVSDYLNLSDCKILDRESLLYLINNLTRITNQRTLTLGETNLAKLTISEKAIVTTKGWTLA